MQFLSSTKTKRQGFLLSRIILSCFALSAAVACGEPDVILEGARSPIRPEQVEKSASVDFKLPQQNSNARSDQRIENHAFRTAPQLVFQTSIGQGNTRRARITSTPVVTKTAIFTIDSHNTVSATSLTGAPLWMKNISTGLDSSEDASGGALTESQGRLYVVTGHGSLTALDSETGQKIWTQKLKAPSISAPVVKDDIVYVLSKDNKAWAISTQGGRVLWQVASTAPTSGFSSGGSVAFAKDIALFPFAEGEIIATFPKGGIERWRTSVSGERLGSVVGANVSDISGTPVIKNNIAYVGNISGIVSAIDLRNGTHLWSIGEGVSGQIHAAGDSLFFVNDLNELMRLRMKDGKIIWRETLPQNTLSSWGRVTGKHAHYGPIMAGNHLILASSEGYLRLYDPQTGQKKSEIVLPAGATSRPVIAGNTLYIIDESGQLSAYR